MAQVEFPDARCHGECERSLVSRAEQLIGARSAHPLSREVKQHASDLKALIDTGDKGAMEDKMDDLLRLLTELEAAG